MGSNIIVNDTLQITREQGFPVELDIEKHRREPLKAEDFSDRIFEFKNKPSIRIYHAPPIRVFLAENKNGKWLYWGLVHVLEVFYDQVNLVTSGKFKIVYLYDYDEMKKAHQLMDRKPETDYFAEM